MAISFSVTPRASESALHQRIFAHAAGLRRVFPRVLVGPGDDCAVVNTAGAGSPTRALLITVDQLVEGRHFLPSAPIDLIARKAIARSISDIAAMGATPIWGLATGLLPPAFAHAHELLDRLDFWARHWGAPLVGGDIATLPAQPTNAPWSLSVTIAGEMTSVAGVPVAPVLRSGARAGDELWITGRIGNSFQSQRHLTFEPRIREGLWLAQTLGDHLHAMIDVSDGVGRDAGRIADRSGVAIDIDLARVPMHADVADPLKALGEGEDYELLFAIEPGALDDVPRPVDLAPFTRIGRIFAGQGCWVIHPDARRIDARALGWDHA